MTTQGLKDWLFLLAIVAAIFGAGWMVGRGAITTLLVVVGAYTVVGSILSAWQWTRDRTGNSGRFKHWSDDNE